MFNSTHELPFGDADEGAGTAESTTRSASRLSNETLAIGLESIAHLLTDDARERVRREALRRAAGLIRSSPGSVSAAIHEAGVEAVHALGINYELSGIVTDWVRSNRLRWLEQLQSRSRDALAHVPGIGPKLAEELRQVLGVNDLDGLAEVVRDGRLLSVCGFGPKRVKLVAGVLAGRVARAKAPSAQLTLPSYA